MKPVRTTKPEADTEGRALANDPLGSDEILEKFYKPAETERPRSASSPSTSKEKPTHYKIVCISLYNEDIEHLESLVAELKRRGHTKANKSQVIRAALDQIDLSKIPRGY